MISGAHVHTAYVHGQQKQSVKTFMIRLTSEVHKDYSRNSVLKTPYTAAQSPRKSVAFFTSIGFAPMGGSAANKIPFGGICPPSVCGFELLPTCLKSRSMSHTQEQFNMANSARTSVPDNIPVFPNPSLDLVCDRAELLHHAGGK